MLDGFLVTLLKCHIDNGVEDDAAPIDDVEEDAQTWLFEAFVKLQFTMYKKLDESRCKIKLFKPRWQGVSGCRTGCRRQKLTRSSV